MADKENSVKAPRIIKMKKGDKGYGFNLHGERGVVGQFISAVDEGGPAQLAGLCVGDRVIEVNDVNVEAATHGQVVAKIKESQSETTLLVVDKVTDDYLKQHKIPITADLARNAEVEAEESPESENTEKESGKDESVQDNSSKNDEEVEEVGVSVEDYLLMYSQSEEKPAEKEEEVEVEVGDNVDGAAAKQPAVTEEMSADVKESNEEEGKNFTVEPQETAEPDEKRMERKGRMTPPEEPPPAPPSERVEPPKEPEPIAEPAAKEPAAEERAATEPAVKEPVASEPTRGVESLAEPPKPGESLLKKNASLPKPKRKEIKEKKGTDWASRAAIFNNL